MAISERRMAIGAACAALGLLFAVLGSFLPWLVSGGVQRNSYAIVGIVGRLRLAGSGFAANALSFWPLFGPFTMLAVIAAILRLWRTAAVVALLVGLITGLISGGVLLVARGSAAMGVGVANQGPVCTAIGSLAATVGALAVLHWAPPRRSRTDRVSREPPTASFRRTTVVEAQTLQPGGGESGSSGSGAVWETVPNRAWSGPGERTAESQEPWLGSRAAHTGISEAAKGKAPR